MLNLSPSGTFVEWERICVSRVRHVGRGEWASC